MGPISQACRLGDLAGTFPFPVCPHPAQAHLLPDIPLLLRFFPAPDIKAEGPQHPEKHLCQ